jgi:DNA-directed RNA polymerase specialized sigma24 family protein
MSIIRNVFSYDVDYDEFVNEFYIYLMENDAYRLKQFQGRSSLYQWLKVVAIRYFIAKRDNMIDMQSNKDDSFHKEIAQTNTVDTEKRVSAKIDIEHLFSLMPNKRYVQVIKRLVLDDAEPQVVADELQVSIDNLYNIKKRAIAAITDVALKNIEKYENRIYR